VSWTQRNSNLSPSSASTSPRYQLYGISMLPIKRPINRSSLVVPARLVLSVAMMGEERTNNRKGKLEERISSRAQFDAFHAV